ncbi:MAG: type II toxin-antitoxin system RelE/ParE family toxin [archaeon]
MYNFSLSEDLKAILERLSKKDKKLNEQVMKKIEEIVNCYDVEHYKNLKYEMKEQKRVHIGHFVLIFRLENEENEIKFIDFQHHDKVYKR